jgi:SAM-dependent methyltransferase
MKSFAVDPTWTDKDSKVAKFRELYERNDFLTAYAAHTDLRMQADPKWAIGRGDEWESHGQLQLDFLIQQGLQPAHKLLDVGCGPGRAARRFVPYLNPGRYWGLDISPECLAHSVALSDAEGWAARRPVFMKNADLDLLPGDVPEDDRGGAPFDFIWAHSVFTHLPSEQIDKMIGNVAKLLPVGGQFLFTYKPAPKPQRSGLKQFQFPFHFFLECASRHGLTAKELPKIWPASQRTGAIVRTT